MARWCGGVKEYPAIVMAQYINEEVEKFDKKTKTMIMVEAKPEEAFTYDLKYADGCVEKKAKGEWVTFDQRPSLEPEVCVYFFAFPMLMLRYSASLLHFTQSGLFDPDFLNAPKPSFGLQTIEDLIRKLQDRQVEVKAADQMNRLVAPDVPGRLPGERGEAHMSVLCDSNVILQIPCSWRVCHRDCCWRGGERVVWASPASGSDGVSAVLHETVPRLTSRSTIREGTRG